MFAAAEAAGSLETTRVLLDRARAGDGAARNRLFERYLPALCRFAHGRLPARARGMLDTGDLVQNTVIRTLGRLDALEYRGKGSLLSYLRQSVLNQIRDEARRAVRLPARGELHEDIPDPARSPLEETIGMEKLSRYEAALSRLPSRLQEAVMLRIEMACSYEHIAQCIGSPSANAARMAVSRGLMKLAADLSEYREEG